MKISYFNYHWEVDGSALGAAAQIRSITSALTKLGHEVDLQFRNPRSPAAGIDANQPAGLKQFPLLRRYGHVPKLLWRNHRYIAEENRLLDSFRPDVLLSVSSYCNFSGLYAAGKRAIPFVLFADGPLEYEYSLFFREYYRYPAFGRWLEGLVMRSADQVICISEILKGFLVQYGLDARKIHVVPNGIDAEAFKPGVPDSEILDRYNLQGRVVVGYIGSFQFFSDLQVFIDIAAKICRNNPNAFFLFVGAGPVGAKMQSMAQAAGLSDRMVFTGMVPHARVPRYLSVMDVVISPYRDDYLFYGSSMKLLEYMAAGKPSVITALGQIKELVHDGCNGMLYEPGDYASFALKTEVLVRDRELRMKIGAGARKSVEANWTWERQASRIAAVLQRTVECKK
ncbi:MAG: glycosyltransferase family 4 protein [Syntrophobacteraceae bacterium]